MVFSQSKASGQYTPSLSDNAGYVKLDNGLIIQYGMITDVWLDECWYTVTFPIPFPHKAFTVNATLSPTAGALHNGGFIAGGASAEIKGGSLTTTGVVLGSDAVNSGADVSKLKGDIWWMAIGY